MKPTIPKGTRDFSPKEMVKRTYLFDVIKGVFKLYGYLPIETTSIENLETLMGKYGEEGDRLIFKILNSGDFMAGYNGSLSSKELAPFISEKALRYDLTVPFARYVAMNRNDITFPFKRYQIQLVWRADRPQKGRYREFYQCDADVIGSSSLLNEVELIQMTDEIFTKLKIPVVIKINNRKILQGIAEYIGAPDRMIDIATAIDKIDKIGSEGMISELKNKGFSELQTEQIRGLCTTSADLNSLATTEQYKTNTDFRSGVDELKNIIALSSVDGKLEFDISLARGLNYYTGTIIEVEVDRAKCKSQFTSSIAGGGRYDNLTGLFGLPGISGVGISFGADRIYDVMEELNLFPPNLLASTQVMFINFGEEQAKKCLVWIDQLRKAEVSAELYPDAAKFKKQMGYADDKKIAYVAFAGDEEIAREVIKVKNMASGEEKEIPMNNIVEHLSTAAK